jgi:lysyl-tRNA synthetase class 2
VSEAPAEPPVPGWPEESAQRLAKARAIRELGLALYPTRFERSHRLGEIVAEHGGRTLEELEALSAPVRVAGRVLTKRGHGKASFATITDGETRLQLYVRVDAVGEAAYRLFELVDLGDFVGAEGRVMRTRKGELSVEVRELVLLSKALLPPPEKWHGLADVEARYRQRYLDLLANPEVREAFVVRSAMVKAMRRFLDERGYLEVETPMMQPIAGGAVARPFVTHHNALDVDLYLRIAPELYLKRLVVGGFERVYEINRNFRNEGISSMHNPEFTMLEFYTAWFDCRDVKATTEELIAAAAEEARPGAALEYRGRAISFRPPFRRVRMTEAIAAVARELGFAIDEAALDDPRSLAAWLSEERVPETPPHPATAPLLAAYRKERPALLALSHGERIARLFETWVECKGDLERTKLFDPTFVVDYPVEISPLAKAHPERPAVADRFELFAGGMEIANGFSELNDPLEQRERFLDQLRQREKGDDEAHRMDEDYVRALGHGLPPTGGCGVGIDRMAMLLTGQPSIRDVILFPHMRPEAGRGREGEPG